MDPRIRVALAPTPNTTFLLATDARGHEILKARLAPPSQIHRWAATLLLEGLSLWCQTPLSVVLCVDDEAASSGLQLSDGFGFGHKSVFYDVEVLVRPGHSGPDFRQLRQICRRGSR
jgi:hypothetical protein